MTAQQDPSTLESQRAASVYALFAARAAAQPQNDLLVLPEKVAALWSAARSRWSYGDAQAEVARLIARYAAAGYGPGHRVALLLENRPEHFLHWLALNGLGAAIVPVNPDYREDELDYLLSHSESVLAVRLPARAGQVDPVAARLGLPVIGPHEAPPPAPARPKAPRGIDAECALIYTSGTTGRPKGCILSNRFFLGWAEWYPAQGGAISLTPGAERLMTPLPTFHVNAMGHSFMGMLGAGGAQIIIDRFHPRDWWETAIETGATCFHYLGVMPAILLELPEAPQDRGHSLRFGLGGGVHPGHHARFEARFGVPLLEGWAMTETGGAGTFCAVEAPRHVGERCIGRPDRPGPAMEIRILDDAGADVPPGTPGELVLRAAGPDPRRGFFSGYLKNAEATEAAWEGGWLHTGDVMRQGPDGAVFFVDRKKNIIRRSGENIAAVEVEQVLASVPGVRQVAAIAALDPLRGEEVMAVVLAGEGADRPSLARALFEACASQLAYYKVPGWVVFVEEMPTTSTQKVRKAALRDLAEAPETAPGALDFRAGKQALRTRGA
ncbi:ATP-dependent acyl-CoA ligase (plasmid) [Paroceanicella profunda]|uniref:ATP-dependent acyl-CoA ligase n=1 Tax=Paroceanicella profunda TaxID=2579971 RepID=A0A5B8G3B2_9RHOB|nr:AMP-binding protein [Paroceanicella profunda]QDL94450.1 ATP-dependent acyl-CoA ligase [Paroceanicella profunda]